MANPNIPLSVQGSPDTGKMMMDAQAQGNQNQLAIAQTLKAHYEGLDQREQSRLRSVIAASAQLKPFLDSGDADGALRFLTQRRAQLTRRMGGGELIDTEDTDAAIAMVREGRIDELKQTINGLHAAGQVYGILDSSEMPSDVRSAEWYRTATPEQRKAFDATKRSQQFLDLGGSYRPVNPGGGYGDPIDKSLPPVNQPENIRAGEEAKLGAQHDADLIASEPKAKAALGQAQARMTRTIRDLKRAKGKIDGLSAGTPLAQVLSGIWGTGATDLKTVLDTVRANIGFDELNQMRQSSPTGGALGAITERELMFLQNVIANLEQSQSTEQLRENLDYAIQDIEDSWGRIQDAYLKTYSGMTRGQGGGAFQPVNVTNGREVYTVNNEQELNEALQEGFKRQ